MRDILDELARWVVLAIIVYLTIELLEKVMQ